MPVSKLLSACQLGLSITAFSGIASVVPAQVSGQSLTLDLPTAEFVPPPPELEELQLEIMDRIEAGRIGALSLMVIAGGEVIWAQGFGKAHPDTIYPVGSVSKSLVGLAASILVSDGKLDLEAPVAEVLESFQVHTGSWVKGELRVRDLASMTAGMPHGGMSWLRDFPATAAEGSTAAVRNFAVVDEEPGREYRYSNYTSGVLEAVVQDVSGQSLQDFLSERVFAPLGMDATRALRDADDERTAQVRSGEHVFASPPFSTPSAGQGFYSSARDLARLALLHLDPDLASGIGLPEKALADSRRPADGKVVGRGGYWSGWGTFGNELRSFSMSNGQVFEATACMLLSLEEDLAAICLTDTQWDGSPGGGPRLADLIAMQVMDAMVGGCSEALREVERAAMTANAQAGDKPASAVEGSWAGTIDIAGTEQTLTLEFNDAGGAAMTFGSIRALSGGVRQDGGLIEASFRCRGEMDFFGEVSQLSRIRIRLQQPEADRLVGSAVLSASSSSRRVTGSGAALIELRR
ncbi:MAG: serine hydrolase domain-containing protein [Planctomycetota bacterium]|jgi:CubicO group peptidase (beta-lactamase class C family)